MAQAEATIARNSAQLRATEFRLETLAKIQQLTTILNKINFVDA